MTDDEMAQVAWFLRRQLLLATPETYTFVRTLVQDMHGDFSRWFRTKDPDFLPDQFEELIFGDYPENLYG